jgi:hypothetical protein
MIVFVPAYLIDPYNVFHWNNIRNNGVEPNKNYIKTKYVLANQEKFDGFVFGSSKVGSIHVEKIPNMTIYNMTSSGCTPYENYETLKVFIDSGIIPKVIYLGVDGLSYSTVLSSHNLSELRASYQYLKNPYHFIKLYMRPSIVLQSIPIILTGKHIINQEYFYSYGWGQDYDYVSTYDWSDYKISIGTDYRFQETLGDIYNIKKLCDDNDIELVVFSNPLYYEEYNAYLDVDYIEFLLELAEITGYINFSGINEITKSQSNYYDPYHYTAYVGDLIIDAIVYNKVDEELYSQGFGWYVTTKNVDDLIELLNSQITVED